MIDNWLDRITMYRLVLYYLIGLLAVAIVLSFAGVLGYNPIALTMTISVLLSVCWLTNRVFAWAFSVPANSESTYISALILALIITPVQTPHDIWFLVWAAVWAMASKFIIAINKKHLFNPVAFGVALTYLMLNQSASWWVGNAPMLQFVFIGGILIVRKIGRADLVWSFLITAFAATMVMSLFGSEGFVATVQGSLIYSPLFFFAFIILTEPLTTPATRNLRIAYGMLAGILSAPQIHIGAFYVTPELTILIANLFSFIVSPKKTLVLRLKEKVQLSPDVYDFIFAPKQKLAFAPGQYMEWTLGHEDVDGRGNRRYFTLASSPTEDNVRLGIKFNQQSSTFKHSLLTMDKRKEIVAAHVAGDFVLPKDPRQKCVFIAGGIGITPFRSMIKYLLDMRQPRPIVLFYVNKTVDDIVYQDVLQRAKQQLGIQTVYTLTDARKLPPWWDGLVGHITPQRIQEAVPDYRNCIFYLSGPKGMVDSFKQMLSELDVKGSQIKTDYFAGLA